MILNHKHVPSAAISSVIFNHKQVPSAATFRTNVLHGCQKLIYMGWAPHIFDEVSLEY